MDIFEFRATVRPVTDELWDEMVEWGDEPPIRENCLLYNELYLIHMDAEGLYWAKGVPYVDAVPDVDTVPYGTREEAEEALYAIYAEHELSNAE